MSEGVCLKESTSRKVCSIPFLVSGIVAGSDVASPAFPTLSPCLINQTCFVRLSITSSQNHPPHCAYAPPPLYKERGAYCLSGCQLLLVRGAAALRSRVLRAFQINDVFQP